MLRNISRASRRMVRRNVDFVAPAVRARGYFDLNLPKQIPTTSKNLRLLSTSTVPEVDQLTFEHICNETLESLCDYFDEIVESSENLKGADVTYGDGVLTVQLGSHGTYVINRQTPNKQIWLSSPVSGPKRYDLVLDKGGYWVYRHDGVSLHRLLQDELSKLIDNIDFSKCSHSLV